jgi:hypothetical protein
MKKLITLTLAVTMIFASCSKERKLNRRLDGDWTVSTDDGAALPAGESMTFSFDKDKKDDGKFTETYTDSSGSETYKGTYQLTKDDVITLKYDDNDMELLTVKDYSKTELTLTSSYGEALVLKKK